MTPTPQKIRRTNTQEEASVSLVTHNLPGHFQLKLLNPYHPLRNLLFVWSSVQLQHSLLSCNLRRARCMLSVGAVSAPPFEGTRKHSSHNGSSLPWSSSLLYPCQQWICVLSAFLYLFLALTISKSTTLGAGEIVQWVECKHEDLSLLPRTHGWSSRWYIPISQNWGSRDEWIPGAA